MPTQSSREILGSFFTAFYSASEVLDAGKTEKSFIYDAPKRSRVARRIRRKASTRIGVLNGEGPPVPIPNTEVKLTSADDTCLETDRENRSMPIQRRETGSDACLFLVLSFYYA